MALEAGKLYLLRSDGRGGKMTEELVMIITMEKVKPIYTKFNIFWLKENKSEKRIIDKFGLEKFEAQFTEVTDEKQIEESRKRMA